MRKDAIDLGKFEPLSKQRLEELLRKGVRDAEELDRTIWSSFEMTAEDANMRLR